ncbi:MAG: hypothetical protein PHQ54_02285 [Candidatus Omnitrophica bacterium]|nr:hypothetical protein [Candidatus Omnitrophota bacterium]
MVKFAVLILGVVFVILGILGMIAWWPEFLIVLKGFGSPFLAFVGAIMAIAAVGEIRDAMARKKEEAKEAKEQPKTAASSEAKQ